MSEELNEFKTEVRTQFKEVRKGIADLTDALRELVRVDGNVLRIEEKVDRMGEEVDDHEARIRVLEEKPGRMFEVLIQRLVLLAAGGAFGYVASLFGGG